MYSSEKRFAKADDFDEKALFQSFKIIYFKLVHNNNTEQER